MWIGKWCMLGHEGVQNPMDLVMDKTDADQSKHWCSTADT